MKRWRCQIVVMVVAGMTAAGWAGEDKGEAELRLSVDLSDGSRIIGTPGIESVPFQTPYAKLDIPLKRIVTLRIHEDHETASLDLLNGDKLTGVINLAPIELETVFGRVAVGIEHIREIGVEQAGGALPEALQQGLVLYYSFDRDEGGRVADASGCGHDARACGVVWTPGGVSGGAYEFDGSNAFIDLSSHASAVGPSSGSLSLWFRYQPGGAPTVRPVLYSVGTQGDQYNYGYVYVGDVSSGMTDESIAFHGPTHFQILMYVPRGEDRYQDNRWHHLVVVADGGDNCIFVDGVREKVSFMRGSATTGGQFLLKPGANRFWLGKNFNYPSSFRGAMDEFRIYNRALSESEVRALHRMGRQE